MMRIVKSLAFLLLGLVLLAALLFGAVQTPPGKAMLARLASSLASSPQMTVEISDISGLVPFDMRIGAIAASDADGPVARVDDLHLAWRPLALLDRTLDITRLAAARVHLLRLPAPLREPPPPGEPPSFALPIRIAELSLGDIVLDEPVLGHAARLTLTGSADIASLAHGLSLDFALQRLDAPGSVTGHAAFAPDTGRLDLDIAAREPAGGLMARAAGLDGLPEIAATLKGAGPLNAWDGQLGLSVGDIAQASGAAGIRAVPQGHRLTLAIDADMARLLPADIAPLFDGRTELAGAAVMDPTRRITLEPTTLRAAGLGAVVSGTRAPDGTLDLTFDAKAGDAARFAALAPGLGWQTLGLAGTLKGDPARPSLDAGLTGQGLAGAGYGAATLRATLRTVPENTGALAVIIEGDAEGLSAEDPEVASALGTAGSFSATGSLPANGAITLTELTARLTALTAHFTGTATTQVIDGDLDVQRLDLAAFGPLAGRPLAGQAALKARVAASADFARLSLDMDGTATGLVTGIAQLDRLFGPSTRIAGAVARDGANAIAMRDLKINTDGLAVTVDGRIATDLADLTAKVALDNLNRLDPRVTGALQGEAAFSGTLDKLGVTATLRIPQGTALERPLRDIALDVTATDITGAPSGTLRLSGDIAGKAATGTGTLASVPDGGYRLSGLDLAVGSVTARGDLALAADLKATGRLTLAAGNLADISALALTEVTGRLNADVTLDVVNGQQRVAATGDAASLGFAGRSLASARIDATVTDPLGVPLINGSADLRGLDLDGTTVESATVKATGNASGTDMSVEALAQGFTLRAAGRLSPQEGGARLRLDRLAATRGSLGITSAAPATLTLNNGAVAIDRLVLNASGGSVTVAGTAGQTLDLTVDARALPLSLADLASPGLNLSGTLAGNARLTGPAGAPNGSYDLRVTRLSSPDLARSGAGPFDIAATGALAGGRATVRATVNGQNLQGLTINGSVPVGPGDLDLAIRGAINLAIVNPMLATTGARALGTANVDATLRGTAAAPRAGGTVRISGGRFDDNVNGVALDQIQAVLTGTDRSITLTSFTGRTTNGGSVTGRGTIALDPAAGFPGRIDLDLVNAAIVNSDLMRLVAEGRLGVEGAFLNGPRLTGRITLRALDISIPDRFGGGVRAINVRHVNASKAFTAKRELAQSRPTGASRNDGIGLDLVLAAPNNTVFVRGLGMDAQLGGELRLTGSTRAPIALGGFELRRGTFDFAGRRLTFTRGRITFTGTTDPELDFVAETTSNEVTARILITGPASRPEVSFTSTPTLPQDEVVARLMFGRSAGNLNAGQAVQVAQAVAQFSGGSGALENLRRSLGVDSLDIGTNEAGTGGQVGIGRRLNDNIYLGVRQGTTSGSSKVTVDIDVTRNIRLQGATGADGSAEVGIGAQWDY
ncbi:translocation/assembly module TamB domain-containing protein [Ancylobacter radicis]|uniref:Translocation/assembly module TamB domain-containing protein n=1 Tax=Ancylobacter radicis TaxID=2836179 RepID=A0ABS5R829_9HYPH|nr:translocation/assembly module TamB domain-containing protein [Ancylobacter radicis]MBS9477829.1 translocation/assembly module TamB domain-containing protein [Ancylobacter radicis]